MSHVLVTGELRDLDLGAIVPRKRQPGESLDGPVDALYVVSARPGGRTWLVAVLHQPTHDGEAWNAAPNEAPLTDVSAIVTAGAPRVLTDGEIAALATAITADRSPAPAPVPPLEKTPARPAPRAPRARRAPALPPVAERIEAEVRAPPAVSSDDDLVAEILANPADRALRERYARQFGPSGDVRAELIALQLLPKPDKAARARIKEIERADAATLAGPLAGSLKSGAKFSLGFLSECAIRSDTPPPLDSPYWSTVEVLDVNGSEIAASPALRSLRSLRQVRAPFSWPPRPHLASLQVVLLDPGDLAALATVPLPALVELELELGRPHLLTRLDLAPLSGPLGRRLHTLGWTHQAQGGFDHDRIGADLFGRALARMPELPELRKVWAKILYGYFTATYTATRAGDRFELVISAPPQKLAGWWEVFVDNVCLVLMGLGPSWSVRFEVRATDPDAMCRQIDAIDGPAIDPSGIRAVS